MSITYKPVEPAEAGVGESMPESFVKEAERSRERFVSLIDETERLQAETAKLRELLQRLLTEYRYMRVRPRAVYLQHEGRMRAIEEEMRELGIEVES